MDRQLLNYLPHIIRDVREYKAVLNEAEQPEFILLWPFVNQAFTDQFVETATEYGVSRWEAMLKISPKADETLDERKFRVLTRLIEQTPFTLTTLRQQLEQLCGEGGYSVTLEHDDYHLIVRIALGVKSMFDAVNALLDRILPANLTLDLSLMYNTYGMLKPFTHEYLKRYTHYVLRNEELM